MCLYTLGSNCGAAMLLLQSLPWFVASNGKGHFSLVHAQVDMFYGVSVLIIVAFQFQLQRVHQNAGGGEKGTRCRSY